MQVTALSEFDFYSKLAQSSGTSLVFFTAPGCGSCRAWLQLLQNFNHPVLQQCFSVDAQLATALAREYDVFHLPSLFLFVNGRYQAPIQAQASPSFLAAAIADALAQPAHDEP